jgi:hypothetical protein
MNHFIIPQNDSKIKQNNPAIPSYQSLPKLEAQLILSSPALLDSRSRSGYRKNQNEADGDGKLSAMCYKLRIELVFSLRFCHRDLVGIDGLGKIFCVAVGASCGLKKM